MTGDPTTALRKALADHRAEEGLAADGGVEERWVKTKLGPIPFAYPNTKGRQKVVVAHDLHHALAGYGTSIAGEGELAAWELGTGMDDRTGVRLAIRVLGFALVAWPSRLFRAFVRGRHCRNLLNRPIDDALLERTVADLRGELGLDRPVPAASDEDRRAFRVWAAKGVAIVWGPLLPLAALAWWWWG